MKRVRVEVLYYIREEYGYKRHKAVMSEADYMDLCMEDVIIKRKKYV